MAFYRCGNCSLNLPPKQEYRKCPQCDTPTAVMKQTSQIMDEEEIAYIKFERYLQEETPIDAARRQAQFEQEQAREEHVRKVTLERFEAIIAGGGWRDWERRAVKDVEEAFDLYLEPLVPRQGEQGHAHTRPDHSR